MSRRYRVDDLLKLRESPLVAKPTSLPPNEEWIGQQDVTTRRPSNVKAKPDDTTLYGEGFQKRPNLIDRKSSTGEDNARCFQ